MKLKMPPFKVLRILVPAVIIALGVIGLAYSGKDFQTEAGVLIMVGGLLQLAFYPYTPKRHIGGKPRRPWERRPKRHIGTPSTLRAKKWTLILTAAIIVVLFIVFKPFFLSVFSFLT